MTFMLVLLTCVIVGWVIACAGMIGLAIVARRHARVQEEAERHWTQVYPPDEHG